MENTKHFITKFDFWYRYPQIDTLVVTEECEPSEIYFYEGYENVAYIPHKSFSWGLMRLRDRNLSIPDFLEIDVERLSGIHFKSVIIRTQNGEYEYSYEEFSQFFSRKLVYPKDIYDAPNRKYRLKPITTEVLFDNTGNDMLGPDSLIDSWLRRDIEANEDRFSFRGQDVISRELGDKIRKEAENKKRNTKLVTIGQEIVQIAGDIIKSR